MAKQFTNDQAVSIIENEGLAYAVVRSYWFGDDFRDPETKKLWNAANEALTDLVRYLEEETGRDVD